MSAVLGIDPGFSACGFAVVELLGCGEMRIPPFGVGVWRTAKSTRKARVLASDDNFHRARELAKVMGRAVTHFAIEAVCVESMSWPRNAGSAVKVALCWGALAAVCQRFGLPVVSASPQEIKGSLCGRRDASKEEVAASICKRFHPTPLSTLIDAPPSLHEHAFDALAAVVACERSDVLLALAKRRG